MKRVLVDTGPLVAILSPSDHRKEACVSALKELPKPLLTCWPVITEAVWLLREFPQAIKKLLAGINDDFLTIPIVSGLEAEQIARLMEQYASLGPQFADATLVYLAHRENIDVIFTLDRRDFSVYRNARKKPFTLIPE